MARKWLLGSMVLVIAAATWLTWSTKAVRALPMEDMVLFYLPEPASETTFVHATPEGADHD
jgi:hypothetical protein